VRANFVLSGVATGMRRNLTMTIALVLSTAITLFFVGLAILADREIAKFRHDYEAKLSVSVYLCTKPVQGASVPHKNCPTRYTEAEKQNLETALNKDPAVQRFGFISEADAVARYRKTVDPATARLTQVGDLPASFTVHLKDLQKDFVAFQKTYSTMPGVSGIQNQSNTLKTLLKIIDDGRLFSIILAGVVLIASVLLIANAIQVAASQRKNETSIMRLVGASRWMTELPFMIETVVAAFIGGLISLGLITAAKELAFNGIFKSQIENGVIPNLGSNDILVAGGVGLIGGVVVAALTAFATLRLYVKL
jgi:cell division transport system permease protein